MDQKRHSIDRIKKYHEQDYLDYNNDIDNNNEYLQYQKEL